MFMLNLKKPDIRFSKQSFSRNGVVFNNLLTDNITVYDVKQLTLQSMAVFV